MTAHLRRLISLALVVMFVVCTPRAGSGEDRLIWKTKGVIQAISAASLTLNGFSYKLTSTTVYEKNDQHTSMSVFSVGDYVEIQFITDQTVIKVEGKSANQSDPTGTPAPVATPVATPEVTKHTAKLDPLGASTTKGESVGSYSDKESKFTLRVKIPRNTVPLATTDAQAKALKVTATITRDDELVATCTTAFETKRAKKFVYEFTTEIEGKAKTKGVKSRFRKGRCVLANGSPGLPTVRSGDLVTVSEASAGEFLRGDF